ncbi:hypothetical protein WJX74_010814 [Apatococcus lobatus]|uniref:Uncharacterized protein n=1 Tax=Apatococcus lobatus TaxID=904363 RepID=A0AAW1R1J6_9CHLO
MEGDAEFWHLSRVLLGREQEARLRRMDQNFRVMALCCQDPLHVILRGSEFNTQSPDRADVAGGRQAPGGSGQNGGGVPRVLRKDGERQDL